MSQFIWNVTSCHNTPRVTYCSKSSSSRLQSKTTAEYVAIPRCQVDILYMQSWHVSRRVRCREDDITWCWVYHLISSSRVTYFGKIAVVQIMRYWDVWAVEGHLSMRPELQGDATSAQPLIEILTVNFPPNIFQQPHSPLLYVVTVLQFNDL